MPTYLCHGFRWERQALRGWVVLNDVDDAAPDWIIAPLSAEAILRTMAENHPFVPFGPGWRVEAGEAAHDGAGKAAELSNQPSSASEDEQQQQQQASTSLLDAPIRLLEEFHYDEDAVDVATPPFAYVADHVVRVDAGVDVGEEMHKYESLPKKGEDGWFEKLMVGLRILGEGTSGLGWHVVVCDDEERADMGWDEEEEEEEEADDAGLDEIQEVNGREERDKIKSENETKAKGQSREREVDESRSLKSRLKKMVPIRKKEKD